VNKFQRSSAYIRELLSPGLLIPTVPVEDAAEPSDRELVERARGGEREAFAFLYRRHQANVYRFARAMTGSAGLAEDIVQDVFLTFIRDLDRYDAGRAALRSYLFGMARNLARYRMRSLKRLLSLDHLEEVAGSDDPALALSTNEESRHLRRCLRALPARYREVIILCDLQELDYVETAAVLAVPIGTVRSRLHRARQLLVERLRRRSALRVAKGALV